jgi:hypothetical protein
MHPINFNVRRSSFHERIAAAVHNSDRLSQSVEIELDKPGGYARDVEIEIGDDPYEFRSTWNGAERRFSARLRAAATVLRDSGLRGRFHAVHRDGHVILSRA